MTAADLKESILQQSIQGKLVPQRADGKIKRVKSPKNLINKIGRKTYFVSLPT